ncbi:MAG: hypothetical protein AAGB51_08635 [Planctomycetota bacterium]
MVLGSNPRPAQEDTSAPVLIVVGAHPRAERLDRPVAYDLAREPRWAGSPLILTDLWYLNHPQLTETPTVSVGPPDRNALTASLADRLPAVWAIDGRELVQMDTQTGVPLAACWGEGEKATETAVDAFVRRHLAAFLDAVVPAR